MINKHLNSINESCTPVQIFMALKSSYASRLLFEVFPHLDVNYCLHLSRQIQAEAMTSQVTPARQLDREVYLYVIITTLDVLTCS